MSAMLMTVAASKMYAKQDIETVQNSRSLVVTLPETNIFAPDNGWSEATWQVRTVRFREGMVHPGKSMAGTQRHEGLI